LPSAYDPGALSADHPANLRELTADHWLPANLNALKWGVVEEIEKLCYTPEISLIPREARLASAKAWSPFGRR
jgi:hypothetical protein